MHAKENSNKKNWVASKRRVHKAVEQLRPLQRGFKQTLLMKSLCKCEFWASTHSHR